MAMATSSCHEFRNGYRVQHRAYERRSETPTLASIISNRRPKNEYVDRLKLFYKSDNSYHNNNNYENNEDSFPRTITINVPNKFNSSNNNNNNNHNTNASEKQAIFRQNDIKRCQSQNQTESHDKSAIKSILRLPDMQRPSLKQGMPTNCRVKISTPHRDNYLIPNRKNSNQFTMTYSSEITKSHCNHRVPPPVPINIRSAPSILNKDHINGIYNNNSYVGSQHNLRVRENNINNIRSLASSSQSADFVSSILEAVSHLRKTRSSRNSSIASSNQPNRYYYSQQKQSRHYRQQNRLSDGGTIDPKNLSMKMSLPCRVGCCYCVYTSILGPVKVYVSKGQKVKKEACVSGIRDGYGRLVIPASRKCDVKGLVYDAKNHSLHPPAKGQRPLYPSNKKVAYQSSSKYKSSNCKPKPNHKRTQNVKKCK